MSEKTAISWTDHSFNPWTGCTKVSPGCANCYAEGWAKRSGIVQWGHGKPRRRTSESNWKLPIKWNQKHEVAMDTYITGVAAGAPMARPTRPRVFCASLADWLDDEVSIQWLADLLNLIRITPNLDWLLLTKRPENFRPRLQKILDLMGKHLDLEEAYLRTFIELMLNGRSSSIYTAPEVGVENYWIGTTVEDQQRANERIPELLKIPAKVRFLSCEPLLESVSLPIHHQSMGPDIAEFDWVIAGGESGPGFRPFNPDWARSLRDQCQRAGVAFHMKQMGGLKPSMMPPIPDDLMIRVARRR